MKLEELLKHLIFQAEIGAKMAKKQAKIKKKIIIGAENKQKLKKKKNIKKKQKIKENKLPKLRQKWK